MTTIESTFMTATGLRCNYCHGHIRHDWTPYCSTNFNGPQPSDDRVSFGSAGHTETLRWEEDERVARSNQHND